MADRFAETGKTRRHATVIELLEDRPTTVVSQVLRPGFIEQEFLDSFGQRCRVIRCAETAAAAGIQEFGKGGMARLDGDGLLGPELNVVHGNYLSDDELGDAVNAGASVTVTPEVELYMSRAVPLTGRLRRLGGKPSMGVDVESGVGGDMFTALRMGRDLWYSSVPSEAP